MASVVAGKLASLLVTGRGERDPNMLMLTKNIHVCKWHMRWFGRAAQLLSRRRKRVEGEGGGDLMPGALIDDVALAGW